jgi:short-subunit dehydrogenase
MKKVIIIGATSGIGLALARQYAAEGHLVGATGRRLALLEDLKTQAQGDIRIRQHDVAAPNQISVVEDLVAELGGVDVLIYNSGIGIFNKKLEFEPERDTIAVNVTGFVETATWAYRYFRNLGGGHIVGVSSVAAIRGTGTAPAYGASKSFISSYMEGLRQKATHEKKAIFVTDIRPGFVDTPMTAQNKGMFWVASSERAAQQIVAAIAARKRVAYITKRWRLVALLMRLMPRGMYEKGGLF